MNSLTAVLLGGGIGAYLRYFISAYTRKHYKITCKNTLLINLIGCLLLGLILALVDKIPNLMTLDMKLFLTTGIIGSFTTFGTFTYENILLLKDRELVKSFSYITLSFSLGVLAVFSGFMLVNFVC